MVSSQNLEPTFTLTTRTTYYLSSRCTPDLSNDGACARSEPNKSRKAGFGGDSTMNSEITSLTIWWTALTLTITSWVHLICCYRYLRASVLWPYLPVLGTLSGLSSRLIIVTTLVPVQPQWTVLAAMPITR